MATIVRNDVTSRAPISDSPTSALTKHITAYVLLAGIVGGLLLVLLVLCFCKMCFKPSKQLSRQPVLFVKYPSDKQGAGNRGSRKYKSLDPSVTIDLETSCGYSENSASPRDQEDVAKFPELATRSQLAEHGEFPWFHDQADVSQNRFVEEEHLRVFSTDEKSPVEEPSVCLSKFRRSPPFCRQTSFCIDSDEQLDQISPTGSGDSILIIEMPKDSDKPGAEPDTEPQVCSVVTADSAAIKSTRISAEVHQTPEVNGKGTPREDDEQELMGAVGSNDVNVTIDDYMPCSSRHPHVTLLDLDSPPDDTQAYYSGLRGPLVPPRVTLLRPSSPLAVVPESEAWEEEEGSSSCGYNAKEENSLRRTTSTESGALESILEERRRQLIRQNAGDDEDEMGEPRAKVRYNDTGSLEEVDDEVLDSYVDEESDLSVEEVEAAMLREQYRKLWRLRATFEEEIQESPPIITLELENTAPQEIVVVDDANEATDADALPERKETLSIKEDEQEATIEVETTTETNVDEKETEQKADEKMEETEECHQQLLTITERRDNYKSILSKRLQKRKAAGVTPGSSADDSFDSVDTEEGSSTDASRLEVATTSLDSTTDTTDSPGDGQASRLQQMKADSGYKSLETATSNGSVSGQKAPRLSRKQIHFVFNGSASDSQVGATTGSSADKDEGMSEDFEASIDDVEGDKNKTTPIRTFPSLSRTPTQGSLSGDLESPSTEEMTQTAGSKASVFTRFFRASATSTYTERRHHPMLTRDFSVDEKSDALFREFSRLDPAYEAAGQAAERARSPRLHPRSHRLHHRHTVDAGDGGITLTSAPPRAGTRRKMSAQENIEEEKIIRLERLGFPLTETTSQSGIAATSVPMIHVADQDSSWKRE